MGSAWFVFFMFPYPNTRGPLWVNFNSPLLWDLFAISTYFTVSLLILVYGSWYLTLLPYVTVRKVLERKIYRLVVIWMDRFCQALAAMGIPCHLYSCRIATPLVLSVHTIVSFDFATSVIPGWHTTIFPPYFVAGAIFSGFAMVQTLMIITRKILEAYKSILRSGHIESMNKVILIDWNNSWCGLP
jgi:Ni/Fe-hydrogenase subunit HybB-like protein